MRKFTENWFNPEQFKHFQKDLPTKKYLEVGAYEGRSLCWMMDNILTGDNDIAYAIDTFKGGVENTSELLNNDMSMVESNYLHNVEEFGDKVVTLKGESFDRLTELLPNHKESFDFIYIDGSHDSWNVLADAVIAFKLLKKGGVMGFDDFKWNLMNDLVRSPGPAIQAFCYTHQKFLKVLHEGYQVWIEKL